MKKMVFRCDAQASRSALALHIEAHDAMATKIRNAILDAFNPDLDVDDEEKLRLVDPVAFRRALADATSEVLGWDLKGETEAFIEEFRRFSSLDDHEDQFLI